MSADLDRGGDGASAAASGLPRNPLGEVPVPPDGHHDPVAPTGTKPAAAGQPGPPPTAAEVAAPGGAAPSGPMAPGYPVPRWLGALILLVAAMTLAWIAELWVTLPSRDVAAHYRLAWVGFDAMLAVVLARTGWLAWRGRDHVELPAVSAATLLVVDMWFDVVTSSTPKDRLLAIASALLVEIPLTVLCLWIAHNAERVRRQRLSWALLVDPRSPRR